MLRDYCDPWDLGGEALTLAAIGHNQAIMTDFMNEFGERAVAHWECLIALNRHRLPTAQAICFPWRARSAAARVISAADANTGATDSAQSAP